MILTKVNVGYEVPFLAKNLAQISGTDFLGNYEATLTNIKNGKDALNYESNNYIDSTLDSERAQSLLASSATTHGILSTFGVPTFVPGKYGESIIDYTIDCKLGNHIFGLCAGISTDSAASAYAPWASIKFSGYLGKLAVTVTDEDEDDEQNFNRFSASGDVELLYLSDEVTNFSKDSRAKYTIKLIQSANATSGIRITLLINDVVHISKAYIVDDDLAAFKTFNVHPYFSFYSATSNVTPIELYQYSVVRV